MEDILNLLKVSFVKYFCFEVMSLYIPHSLVISCKFILFGALWSSCTPVRSDRSNTLHALWCGGSHVRLVETYGLILGEECSFVMGEESASKQGTFHVCLSYKHQM